MPGHYVYLVLTQAGAYYCGYSLDPVARVAVHNRGVGAKALRGCLPVRLAFVRRFRTKGAALSFEHELKRQSHDYKRAVAKRWRAEERGAMVLEQGRSRFDRT